MNNETKEELKKEFVKWHSSEATFAFGLPDDQSITDWWLSKFDNIINEKVAKIEKTESWLCEYDRHCDCRGGISRHDVITLLKEFNYQP